MKILNLILKTLFLIVAVISSIMLYKKDFLYNVNNIINIAITNKDYTLTWIEYHNVENVLLIASFFLLITYSISYYINQHKSPFSKGLFIYIIIYFSFVFFSSIHLSDDGKIQLLTLLFSGIIFMKFKYISLIFYGIYIYTYFINPLVKKINKYI